MNSTFSDAIASFDPWNFNLTSLIYLLSLTRFGISNDDLITNTTAENIGLGIFADLKPSVQCFGDIGCLETTLEWFHIAHRPINLKPEEADVIGTSFYVHYMNGSTEMIPIKHDKTWLFDNGGKNATSIKVIVHGYLDNGFSSWVSELAVMLHAEEDVLIIIVDWSKGGLTGYLQAVSNTRVVGLAISHLLNQLYEARVNYSQPLSVHCIGHSLGAHICGYVGKSTRLDKITGLDPAGPLFEGMPSVVRLDSSDADLVEALHTNAGSVLKPGYGISEPVGHIDYYANDGFHQPGCDNSNLPQIVDLLNFENLQRNIFACSHHRAISYYTEAVSGKCQFIGHACESYEKFIKGECGTCDEEGSCAALSQSRADDLAPQMGTKVYFSTERKSPYCVHQYLLTVQTAWPKQAEYHVFGRLTLELHTMGGGVHMVQFFGGAGQYLEHGKSVSMLITSDGSLELVTQIRIFWTKDGSSFRGAICLPFFCNGSLYLKYVELRPVDGSLSRTVLSPARFCSPSGRSYSVISLDGTAMLSRRC